MRTLVNAGELNPGEEQRPDEETWTLTALDRIARRARRAVRDRARPRRAARRGAPVPRADRARLGAGGADPQRRPRLGRAGGLLRRRRAALHRGRTCASPRRCAPRWRPRSAGRSSSRGSSRSPTGTRSPACPTGARSTSGWRTRSRGAREGGELALVFCDLDGLKDVNDRLGHEAGDRALVAAGQALVEAAEAFPGSITCRLGGDEFCVLMEGHGAEAARALARDAAHRLAAGPAGPLTMSCGVACLDEEHRRAADLFRAADAAQYAAKRVGGDKLFVAEPGIPTPPAPGARAVVARPLPRRRAGGARGAGALPARGARRRPARRGRARAARGRRGRLRRGLRRGALGDLAPRAGLTRGGDAARRRAPRPLRPPTRPTCASPRTTRATRSPTIP